MGIKKPKLINSKIRERFFTRRGDLCQVLVKYNWNRITVRNEATKEIIAYPGSLSIIPITN